MVQVLSFEEVAQCLGVSLDVATRVIQRDLPIVELMGRGTRPIRGVDLEALEIYIARVSKTHGPMAQEIQNDLDALRVRRRDAAAETGDDRDAEANLPEIVKAKRQTRRSKA